MIRPTKKLAKAAADAAANAGVRTPLMGPHLDAYLTEHCGLSDNVGIAQAAWWAVECLRRGRITAAKFSELVRLDTEWLRQQTRALKAPAQAVAVDDPPAYENDPVNGPIIDRLGNLDMPFHPERIPPLDVRGIAPRRDVVLTDSRLRSASARLDVMVQSAIDAIGIMPAVGSRWGASDDDDGIDAATVLVSRHTQRSLATSTRAAAKATDVALLRHLPFSSDIELE